MKCPKCGKLTVINVYDPNPAKRVCHCLDCDEYFSMEKLITELQSRIDSAENTLREIQDKFNNMNEDRMDSYYVTLKLAFEECALIAQSHLAPVKD